MTIARRVGRLIALLIGVVVLVALLMVGYVTQPLLLPLRPPASAVRADPARLRSHVEVLATSLVPRTGSHRDNLEQAAEYIAASFTAASVASSFQSFEVQGQTYRNVIGLVGPDTKERIVVGAHYDAAEPGVGADDNASGVAGLLEIARLLRTHDLPMRVELVAFTLEEPPYFHTHAMGSFVHASGLKKAGTAVRAMICLEMIGAFQDAPGSQRYPVSGMERIYPTQGNFIAVVGGLGRAGTTRRVKRAMAESAALPVWSINAPRDIPGIDFSDHFNYWDAGFDAVMVTDTAFYRNSNYHAATDTPQTLDYPRMAAVVAQVHGAILALSR